MRPSVITENMEEEVFTPKKLETLPFIDSPEILLRNLSEEVVIEEGVVSKKSTKTIVPLNFPVPPSQPSDLESESVSGGERIGSFGERTGHEDYSLALFQQSSLTPVKSSNESEANESQEIDESKITSIDSPLRPRGMRGMNH
mmetsp:Transcript_15728/g.24165  ORF Transcript_15728/g.24165 Transcript_15728/m.24165 type:complete len:143 (-) Transcript_15728:735-1163(-)